MMNVKISDINNITGELYFHLDDNFELIFEQILDETLTEEGFRSAVLRVLELVTNITIEEAEDIVMHKKHILVKENCISIIETPTSYNNYNENKKLLITRLKKYEDSRYYYMEEKAKFTKKYKYFNLYDEIILPLIEDARKYVRLGMLKYAENKLNLIEQLSEELNRSISKNEIYGE